MANYNSNFTGDHNDEYDFRITNLEQFRQMFLDMTYPVGSIYMSVNATSPATLFGGAWEALQNRFLVGAGGSYTVNATGGEATHTLTQAETPAHTHTRGTMDITGKFRADPQNGWIRMRDLSGAFYAGTENIAIANGGTPNGSEVNVWANFQASRNWTGATSSVGGNGAHNNMPPYLAVYMWKRTG